MKIISVILFLKLFLFSIPMFSQENLKVNDIYLNDGSFIRGEIIEKVENQYIRIKISGGNIVQFSMNEIKKVKQLKRNYHYFSNGNKVKTKGIHFSILGGMIIGTNDFENFYAKSINLSTGYNLNENFSLGAGIGLDSYEPNIFSVFINTRYSPWRKKVTPYISGKIGYGTPVKFWNNQTTDGYTGGLLLSPSVGFQFSSRINSSFLIEIGYNFQRMKRISDWQITEDEIVFRRLRITLGIQF
ncbi:MAG: hypothetical protein P8M17_10405 [Saprospiraceae bacterium]|nr:hypothetical protein [Saprospiraceae bacterium]MDG2419393.1 hypothetical protein [Saprospiraceae bacterium]